MKILVQKYGGTSVATPEQREQVALKVKATADDGYAVAVVVSAIGRKGQPYATDSLLSLVEDHSLVSKRELDLLMSCGEIISAVCMAGVLRKHGLDVHVFTGGQAGIKTDEMHTRARIIDVDCQKVYAALQDGKVAVVAGFQGITADGEVTTLGRGGSDTTAVALGLALRAERVEIYTDVAGIMTADPRVEPRAKVLRQITYQEVLQMAQKGAKVIHPRAVELAMQRKLPIYITTTSASQEEGTVILDNVDRLFEGSIGRPVTAVAHQTGLTQFRLPALNFDQARQLYQQLAEASVSLDLISINPSSHMFVVVAEDSEKVMKTCRKLGIECEARYHVAKVSAIGTGMHGVPGVLAGIVKALTNRGISILQTSDSHMTISCLIPEKSVATAVQALHQHFNLERV